MVRFIRSRFKVLMPFLFLALPGCTTKTEVYESQMTKEFKNGQTIFIKRTDELTRSYGALSGHLYGENHNVRFKFKIEPIDVEWNGLMGEIPKHILCCGRIYS